MADIHPYKVKEARRHMSREELATYKGIDSGGRAGRRRPRKERTSIWDSAWWLAAKKRIADRVAKQEKVAHAKALERRAQREAEKLGAAK